MLKDERADKTRQLRYVQVMGEVDLPKAVPALLTLGCSGADPMIQAASLSALERYRDSAIAPAVLAALPTMTAEIRAIALDLLASRPESSRRLLEAVAAGRIEATNIPLDVARQMLQHHDAEIDVNLRKQFGDLRPATPAALKASRSSVSPWSFGQDRATHSRVSDCL